MICEVAMSKLLVMYDNEYKKYLSKKDFLKFLEYKSNNAFVDDMSDDLLEKLCSAQLKWARKNGATIFTQIFLPLTGFLSGKYMALYDIVGGKMIYKLDKNILKKCECDASSFPNGGYRSTCCARGYTKWDIHQNIYIAENSGNIILYIPSIFTSYDGTALDNISILTKCDLRLNQVVGQTLKLLGEQQETVHFYVGMEQEYFLLPKHLIQKRKDIALCNRQLLCNGLSISQEQYAHYFALPRPKVCEYMNRLRKILVDVGINIQAQHSEVAPRQYEIVPKHSESTRAVFENAIIRQKMTDIGNELEMIPIFTEKINAHVNGSGKHMNISLSSNGRNYFDTRCGPKLFMLFFTTMIKAVAKHKELLPASVMSYHNDMRLGGCEAPKKEISVYVGDAISQILNEIKDKKIKADKIWNNDAQLQKTLHDIITNNFDRNRTSPFAFTGNKFEYRTVGASNTGFMPIAVLSTVFSEEMANINAKLKSSNNIQKTYYEVLEQNIEECQKIIFNGDNYKIKDNNKNHSKTTLSALKEYIADKNIALFVNNNIFTNNELHVIYTVERHKYIESFCVDKCVLKDIMTSNIYPVIDKFLVDKENKTDKDTLRILYTKLKKHMKKLDSINLDENDDVSPDKYFDDINNIFNQICETINIDNFSLIKDDDIYYGI